MKELLIFLAFCATASAAPPNLVLILVDDMGWNDPGEKPNIDRLAGNGITFTQAYAAAPNCAPTRACLLTGQYTPRHGIYTVVDDRHAPGSPHQKILAAESRAELPAESFTLAEALNECGYATGMVGMWNLGRGRRGPFVPTSQGFDSYVQPKDLGFDVDAYWNADGEYLTDRLTDAAIDFVKMQNGPFFLYLATHAVHAPFDPKPELTQKYKENAEYAATVEGLDLNIGRLMDALPENTVILFTSDNGGDPRVVAPLRGGKGTLYEGGLRVPMILSGPGIPYGSKSDAPVSSIDIFPTLTGLAGFPDIGTTIDGESLVPLWNGGHLKRDALFWYFPCYVGRGTPSSALRKGDWKLIEFFEDRHIELYNLAEDPSENRDLSGKEPEIAKQLYAELQQIQARLGAPLPTEPNPKYDPSSIRKKGRDERSKGEN
jgi:arylsulfatase A